ncbi:MAG: VOC family protein [Verrucomicrobiia bacterium]|jgi:predicted enzyme related to lactoylglutathione lyase
MAKLNRINVVFLYVLNLEEMRKFYEAAFDLGKPVVDAKWWVEYAVGDGSHLALHEVDSMNVERARLGGGPVEFSFDVDDIQHYTDRLKRLGAKFRYEPRQEYGFWLAEFEDIEGNVLRLYEKAKMA